MNDQKQFTDGSASRLLGVHATATYLGITPRSVYRLVEEGFLTPVRLPGLRRTLFDRQNLDDFVELTMAASASQPHEYMGDDGVEPPEWEVRR